MEGNFLNTIDSVYEKTTNNVKFSVNYSIHAHYMRSKAEIFSHDLI